MNQLSRIAIVSASLAALTAACEPAERVIIRTDNLANTRQESREFKIEAELPTRSGTVVTTGIGLQLLATVESPTASGVTLQATDVHWVGDTIYASYNVVDERFLGALQVIDASDPMHPSVVAEAVFPNTDVARVRASGDTLFLAAADAGLGGTFERFRYDGSALTYLGYDRVGSYSATFLDLDDYRVHVARGDEGGGVVTFDVSGTDPVELSTIDAFDARWVEATTDGGVAIVSGSPGRIETYDGAGVQTAGEAIAGANIGAPTWAMTRGDRLYLSSDDAGVLVYDLTDLSSELGRLTTTGNANGAALAVDGRLAFLANGQEGLVVADFLDPADPVVLATLDVSDDAGSANAVSLAGEYIALADGLGGVKILHYDRDAGTPDDCDGDEVPNDLDPDDDNDGVLDEDDEAPCNPDVACEPGEDVIDVVGRFVGDFYNLPCDHPDVEGPVTGVVTGTLPSDFDWYDEQYFVFSRERDSLLMSYSEDYFPVDTGLCGDPYHFAVHWYTTAIVSEAGTYTLEMGSDDDSWLFIDGELVTDLGGIHAIRRTSADVYLDRGPHRIDIYFAERHVVQSGLEFEIVGKPEGATIDIIQHVCLDGDEDTDGDGVNNGEDVSPLTVPEVEDDEG